MLKLSPEVSIIIPLFNESEGVAQLARQIRPMIHELEAIKSAELLLIDDGSTDDTLLQLKEIFSEEIRLGKARILGHKENMNLGAAICTGGDNALGKQLVFYDSDCTYDPKVVLQLVALLDDGAGFATASPYHPKGAVVGVPRYRLVLSRGLSLIYQIVLRAEVHTFTAMVRALDKEVFERVRPSRRDFSAVTEMMIKALKLGICVRELPTELRVRRYGVSKMKVFRTIRAHLGIVFHILFMPGRLFS